jgi:hypothetical protein
VRFDALNKDNYVLEIKNTLGQLIFKETLNGFSGKYSRKIDMGEYGKGFYMMTFSNSSDKQLRKIIVQ